MRSISATQISETIKKLACLANTRLRPDVRRKLELVAKRENRVLARRAIISVLENADVARKENIALCQDTGMPVVFLEIGAEVRIQGNITKIVAQALRAAYQENCFRASIQLDPIFRSVAPSWGPGIIHTDIVDGEEIKITLLPKGFGSENKTKVKMFNPTAEVADIENFVVDSVSQAGASACPPYFIGVGIGGTQDLAGVLAKKALLEPMTRTSADKKIAALEKKILKMVNELNIGAFGYGGKSTALAVRVKTYPTHIAGLPVAVNISCHALRSATAVI